MIVDVHTHLWNEPTQLGQGTLERLNSRPNLNWDERDACPASYDDAMKCVDCAFILGFRSEHLGASIPHTQVAGYVARRRDKYVGFGGIDPLAPGYLDSVDELLEAGLLGVTFSPAAQACHPTHSRAMRLFEKCQQRGLPLLVHPGTHMSRAAMMELSRPHLWDEVGRSFPDLPIVLAQLGHPWVDEALLLISKHRNFFADLTDLSARPWQLYNALLQAYQVGVTDYLLLGSDFPFAMPAEVIVNIYSVNQHCHGTSLPTIPRPVLQGIVERDALTCLGLAEKVTITARPRPDEGDEPAETESSAA